MTKEEVDDNFGRKVNYACTSGPVIEGTLLDLVKGSDDLADVFFPGDTHPEPVLISKLTLVVRKPRFVDHLLRTEGSKSTQEPDRQLPLTAPRRDSLAAEQEDAFRRAHVDHWAQYEQTPTVEPDPESKPKRQCTTPCPIAVESWPCRCKPRVVGF